MIFCFHRTHLLHIESRLKPTLSGRRFFFLMRVTLATLADVSAIAGDVSTDFWSSFSSGMPVLREQDGNNITQSSRAQGHRNSEIKRCEAPKLKAKVHYQ